jgi:sterol desaturase/sphingolipid hydroxylase (fatty acid hydroxylase superfamily)
MPTIFNTLKEFQPYVIGGIFMVIYIAEHISPQRPDQIDYKHDGINLFIGVFNLVVAGLGGDLLQLCLAFANNQHFGLLYFLPQWGQLTAGFILTDLFMYWWHRANHVVPFLWRFHRFHHEDKKLNTSSAVRFHFVELLLSYFFKIPFFVCLGISNETIILYSFIFLPVIILHHSNIRIGDITDGIVRLFVVSPKMHRIHHSELKKETDSNYGSVLPYWDRLFKSYIKKPEKPVEFGV